MIHDCACWFNERWKKKFILRRQIMFRMVPCVGLPSALFCFVLTQHHAGKRGISTRNAAHGDKSNKKDAFSVCHVTTKLNFTIQVYDISPKEISTVPGGGKSQATQEPRTQNPVTCASCHTNIKSHQLSLRTKRALLVE